MTATLLEGRPLAAKMRADLVARSAALRARGTDPRLAIVLASDDLSSLAYARTLEKTGAACGVTVTLESTSGEGCDETSLRARIAQIGADPSVHGLMLQQPLPPPLNARRVVNAIPVDKDVDCAHPANLGLLAVAGHARFVPATPAAIFALLETSTNWPLRGRDLLVVGRSTVVGLPAALLGIAHDATVTVAHSRTRDLREQLSRAEIVIAAIGRPRFISGTWLRPGATVVDAGTTVVDGTLVGNIRDVFRDYLRLLVEFSGVHADIELPEDPVEASFLIGDALQVADSMKQRLLEFSSTEHRLTAELSFLRKLLPQLRSLLERKREERPAERSEAPGGTSRADQEKFFGRHFSQN